MAFRGCEERLAIERLQESASCEEGHPIWIHYITVRDEKQVFRPYVRRSFAKEVKEWEWSGRKLAGWSWPRPG